MASSPTAVDGVPVLPTAELHLDDLKGGADWLPLEPVAAFVDRDYGPWNGRPKAEVERRYGSLDNAPGVEARPALERRVLAGLQAAADQHAGQTFAIVAHDAVNRVLLARVDGRLGDPELVPQRTGCWNRLRQAGGRWRVLVIDAVPGDGHHPD